MAVCSSTDARMVVGIVALGLVTTGAVLIGTGIHANDALLKEKFCFVGGIMVAAGGGLYSLAEKLVLPLKCTFLSLSTAAAGFGIWAGYDFNTQNTPGIAALAVMGGSLTTALITGVYACYCHNKCRPREIPPLAVNPA